MLLQLVCSGILEDSTRTSCLEIQVFYSEALKRIEPWWLILKRQNSALWINFLKDLQEEGLFDPSLNHHKEWMKFCFTGILQIELNNIKGVWKNHCIRNSRNAKYPGGRPDILYFNSAAVGTTDYKFSLAGGKLDQALRFCVYPSLVNCAEDFLSLASLIMIEENLRAPKNTQEAKFLFPRLITVTDSWQFQIMIISSVQLR